MKSVRLLLDKIASKLMLFLTLSCGFIVFLMVFGLYCKSKPILFAKPLAELIFSSSWRPFKGEFGFFPFIIGTLWVTGVAVIIAVPFCILTSIYLSEYAPKGIREFSKPLIDLLAGIPSVVYGVWGVLVIVPLIKDYIAPYFGTFSTGYSLLAAGIILAIMIFPVIIHVSLEVVRTVPNEMREASLSLGATKWQTIKHTVMRKAMPGVIAAIVLGVSRAFGETMAVLMVAGNVAKVPSTLFDPVYPLPALIANNYGEMMSIPLYDSALLLGSLILLVVVLFFNVISRMILVRVERSVE
ncbi:MAG: phosphate ABC transporter permease subunit PstC [Candidatus Omnitrophica bacterium CG07_land_8_20_14_0_80_42_15]|uniref:Phosphate transport system permease protein n=1 Tax=Candidatus Aquitaenariimonas noxiae TaxID=1974741 RepID=A0A2J0KYP8_9BACT|nr:MAG: phosphate ABC transporter permease subunit PstC [Candidatus Omnitrophica bacterium CG07_land_8_20_14_0_80_42_15]